MKQFMNKETLRTLYFSFVYPYLYYCIEVWGNTQDCYRDMIVKLQKGVVRIFSCSPLLAHSEPLFIHLKTLQFKKLYFYTVEYLFLCTSANIIYYHQSSIMYVYNRDVHQVNTRQADKVRPAKYRTVLASESLRILAVGIWNDILSNLDVNLSFSLFKKRLFEYCLHFLFLYFG